MTSRVFEIALFEALTLFQLVWPLVRNGDRLYKTVMASAQGVRALRLFHIAVATLGVGGAMAIALAPDEWLFPWLLAIFMLVAMCPGQVFLEWSRRAVVSHTPEARQRTVVLELAEQKMPRTVWLAVVPPFATLGLITWLAIHWSGLRARGLETSGMVWHDPAFRTIVQFLFMDIGWGVWSALYALIVWHGMPSRYTFRLSQLSAAIANGWAVALLTPAIALPLLLQLPPAALVLCVVAGVSAVWLYVSYALPARRDVAAADMPPSSQTYYFDRGDPAAFGDRGVNLGSPWNWALFAAPMLFFVAPMLLFLL